MNGHYRRAKVWLGFFLIFTLVFGTFRAEGSVRATAAGPLLINTGFEDVNDDGSIPGWKPYDDGQTLAVSESVYLSGKRSLQITDSSPEKSMGAKSEVFPVHAFDNYIVTASVYVDNGSSGTMNIRFFDDSGSLLTVQSALLKKPAGVWNPYQIAVSAPEKAVTADVTFVYSAEGTGTFYVDDVNISVRPVQATITNLGGQVNSIRIYYGAFGVDADGRDVLYTVIAGDPAVFAVVDVKTKKLLKSFPLIAEDGSNASGAWGITVATDGKAYAGSVPNGSLFQYDPATEQFRCIGKPPKIDLPGASGETVIWTLTAGKDGKVYGGTGYEATVFEYDPQTDKITGFGSFKTTTKNYHVHSLAYDPVSDSLYIGIDGVKAQLFKLDLATKTRTEIPLPVQYSGETSVFDMQYIEGKLFVRVDPSSKFFVMDTATGSILATDIPITSRGFSPRSPYDGNVYFTAIDTMPDGSARSTLYVYEWESNTYRSTGINMKGPGIVFDFISLDRPDFPGLSLVAMSGNNDGQAFLYNPQTGEEEVTTYPLPAQKLEIYNTAKGPDGKIYSGGFVSGGIGVFTPSSGRSVSYSGVGQMEGMGSLGGNIYFGSYPNAAIYEYDPNRPWNRSDPSTGYNPIRLALLGDDQDRPVSILGVEEYRKLFIASVPKSGKVGGALTIYDPETKTFDVKRHLVPNHAMTSLAYKDGKLFIGTVSQGGEPSGKLLIWDVAQGKVEEEIVPVPGKKGLASLIVGPDGNIWGFAQGVLFIFDPETRNVVFADDKFPEASYDFWNPRMEIGTDGNVYGTIHLGSYGDNTFASKFFRIDADSPGKDVTILLESGAERLTQDDFGNFYFDKGSELFRYSDPALVLDLAEVQAHTEKTLLSLGESDRLIIDKVLLEKGREAKELDGAQFAYRTSNPRVLTIDENGRITPVHVGKAEVWVTVTLNGVSVDSQKIEIKVKSH